MSNYRLGSGYVRPKIEQFPHDWKIKPLDEVCRFRQGGTLGFTKSKSYGAYGVPAYSAAGRDGYVDAVEFNDVKGVVLSAIGANCGRCFYAEGNWTTLANVQAILPEPQKIDARFLFYRVNRGEYWPRSGSAQPFIKPSDMKACWLAFPPVDQQRIIAQILDTLDTQIRQTEALIAKLERIKQGLLTDLLTRGIDQDGQLRPTPEQAPHLYKASSLGRIPKEWDVRVAGEWCTGVADGTHDSPKPAKDGYPLVTSKNLKPEGLDIHDTYLISKRDYEAVVSRSWVKPGDILFGMIGTVGNPAIIRNGEQNIAPKNVGIFRVGGDYKKGRFLLAVLRSSLVDRQIDLSMLGSTQKFVGLGVLRSLLLPLPPYDELRMIVEVLEEFEERVRKERTELGKLNVEKFGLMDDLLTGRVRVTSLLEANKRARA